MKPKTTHSLDDLLLHLAQGVNALQSHARKPSLLSPPESTPKPKPLATAFPPRALVSSGVQNILHHLMAAVETRFGIHSSAKVERKLQKVLGHLDEAGLADWLQHLLHLPASDPEWSSLVESLTVHETYFYRDKPFMDLLRAQLLPALIESKLREADTRISIWSAGCSTGEELYSIAFLLLEALMACGEAHLNAAGGIDVHPRWQLDLLGTDVSRQVVRVARAGVYSDFGMGSFRDMTARHWSFFDACASQDHPTESSSVEAGLSGARYFRVKPSVTRLVRFEQHNLLTGEPPKNQCDLVICRNVMIYFQAETKREVQKVLHSALQPRATLIIGATDEQYWPDRYFLHYDDRGRWYVKK